VEIGALDKSTQLLTDQQVYLMAEHLPEYFEAPCNNEYLICRDDDFKIITTGGYRVVRVSVDKQYILLKLHGLKYISYIFFMVRNHLNRYTEALPDVLNYITSSYIRLRMSSRRLLLTELFFIINCLKI
jgi:hypothetical protein